MIELPVKRCSLFVREIPPKSVDKYRGIDPYPICKDFKGVRKLPCVEMVRKKTNCCKIFLWSFLDRLLLKLSLMPLSSISYRCERQQPECKSLLLPFLFEIMFRIVINKDKFFVVGFCLKTRIFSESDFDVLPLCSL